MARDEVLELRQYILKPGRRERLIELFATAFIAGHEERGIAILGTFADVDDESRYLWLRAMRPEPGANQPLDPGRPRQRRRLPRIKSPLPYQLSYSGAVPMIAHPPPRVRI